jgi:hypothetical protein
LGVFIEPFGVELAAVPNQARNWNRLRFQFFCFVWM